MPSSDEVFLVTGGSRGIGPRVALEAASLGWSVCLTRRMIWQHGGLQQR
jgi:NAD(P)-dependent dehydrogenase (short-subunit alcohol dehydrogenase family)